MTRVTNRDLSLYAELSTAERATLAVTAIKKDVVRFLAQSRINARLRTVEEVASSVSSKTAMSGFVEVDCMRGFCIQLMNLRFVAIIY